MSDKFDDQVKHYDYGCNEARNEPKTVLDEMFYRLTPAAQGPSKRKKSSTTRHDARRYKKREIYLGSTSKNGHNLNRWDMGKAGSDQHHHQCLIARTGL